MSRSSGPVDHAARTKQTFLFGVALLVVAVAAEPLQHALGVGVPGWEDSLLVVAGSVGLVLAVLSPFVFGIVLPLVE